MEPIALRWHWPEELRLIVATPAVGLATSKARAALPTTVPQQGRRVQSAAGPRSGARAAERRVRSGCAKRSRTAGISRRARALVPQLGTCSRSRIRTCSARSCRAPGRRWPSSRGAISGASSSCSRRCTNAPGVRRRCGRSASTSRRTSARRDAARSRRTGENRMKFVAGLTCHLCGATYPRGGALGLLRLPRPARSLVRLRRHSGVISREPDRVAARARSGAT